MKRTNKYTNIHTQISNAGTEIGKGLDENKKMDLHHKNPTISNQSLISYAPLNPQEEALQSLCKQILKSRLFRGYYEERRHVDNVQGYRDIIALQRGERDLEKLLLEIRKKLLLFYEHQPNIWIGLTNGPLAGMPRLGGTLETYIWTQLDNLAFGQYWFIIKNVRFRGNEVILKLKMVRAIETESIIETRVRRISTTSVTHSIIDKTTITSEVSSTQTGTQVDLQDFMNLAREWSANIKLALFNFLSNDITKENIWELLRFFGLLIVSIVSAAIMGIKFLGLFTLRFMFEFSRFTHVLTPIILKAIEVINKIIGGFYILLAMIWKDMVVNRGQSRPRSTIQSVVPPIMDASEYNRPLYKSIEYNVRQNSRNLYQYPAETERQFQ